MNLDQLRSKLPAITAWIDDTLAVHAAQAKPVTAFNFQRLPAFYSSDFLQRAKVVAVPRVPVPPLTAMGLPEFVAFEHGDFDGITFKDTYFIKTMQLTNESLHFHELVHVVQWAHMGVEPFLLAYTAGLAASGYRNSPLEAMAYALQEHFARNGPAGDVVAAVQRRLNELYPS